ncbi:MAG TPA: M23 family metallopeptidase [Patescibacteria group bacterium]|nr:M23 family metallopeptidase [Patescibacteria group bacterium]
MRPALLWAEIGEWILDFGSYTQKKLRLAFSHFEEAKDWLVDKLLWKRGALQKSATHIGMIGIVMVGVVGTPLFASTYPGLAQEPTLNIESTPTTVEINVMASPTGEIDVSTQISEKPRDKIITYTVQSGDTLSQIAEKFGISVDTIKWENNLSSVNSITAGDEIRILPVTGVAHTVKKSETVYSIAKKYSMNPQLIVDFPFNSFTSEEFDLQVGQIVIVPDGVPPKAPVTPRSAPVQYAVIPSGSVGATGQFIWPAGGQLTQYFSSWHPGIDIANRSAPGIAAADSGTVIVAGYPDRSGYGNRVIIDHGNGYTTLYAHLSRVYVTPGQVVQRGQVIGQMGSSGRSTGTHLHIEIRRNGAALNPLSVLR